MSAARARRHSTLWLLCVAGGLLWGGVQLGMPYRNEAFQLWPCVVWFLAFFCGLKLAIRLLEHGVVFIDWLSSRTPTGKSGTSSWAVFRDYKKALISHKKSCLLWGLAAYGKRSALFFDFVSNALCVAPAGSGKGIFTVVTNILSIRFSKVIVDFKGELVCMLKAPLEKRGEIVRILNPCGLWEDIIGKSDVLNSMDIIVDDLTRPDGLLDVMDDLNEINKQLLPEPTTGEDENKYFRDGSRDIMDFAELVECMINGYDATLSSAALLIKDRQDLEDHARWIAGVDLDGKPHPDGAFPVSGCDWAQNHSAGDIAAFTALLQANAHNILKLMAGTDTRTFDSFITGAQQALKPYAFGRLSSATGRSTFDINIIKDKKKRTSLFIVADASRPELFDKYIGLMQWVILTTMKRHPNKHVPVYFILDEVTNYFIHGLESLLTWGRGFGLRLLLIFQAISAFEKKYGKQALETLLSETEIKQFLPGQRSPRTLTLIKNLLGEQSVMSTGMARSPDRAGLQESQSEAPRPLRTEDEIRRMEEGILFVRQLPPILVEPVAYAEISPWRDQVGINPYHGKAFRKKIKLRL